MTVRIFFKNGPKRISFTKHYHVAEVAWKRSRSKTYYPLSDFERLINYINWFCYKFPMAPGQRLKWHSSISEDDPKHWVPLEQILDLRWVPLPQVTEQRCQDCQADHRGVTEINMLELICVTWSVISNDEKWNKHYSSLCKNAFAH